MSKDIDWANIGFGYRKTDYRYVSNYKDGAWDSGELITDDTITLNESACVLQYAQTCFEGLKAYRTKNGQVVCFRPDLNAKRMADSASWLEMPPFPEDRFIDAVVQTVKKNIDYVPPYGLGASLYIRPYMFGSNPVIGIKPAREYQFRIFTTPVGMYFKGGTKGTALKIPDYDRAAPLGSGHVKAGLNYAMSLKAKVEAHKEGYMENLYLDSATRTKIEETGGANVIFITDDNTIVTPKSHSILPSVTRRSLLYVAEHYLGLKTEERVILKEELANFKECALCGTAAVLTTVDSIHDHGKIYEFKTDYETSVSKKLYDTLVGIQTGEIEAPEGWIKVIC